MAVYTPTELQRILTFIREERASAAQDAAIGKPKSWDAYQTLVGRVRALDDVETEISRITGTQENPGETDV